MIRAASPWPAACYRSFRLACSSRRPSAPAAVEADFDLWRNVMREYSEELLGHSEHDSDGQPLRYDTDPFRWLDQARRDGRIRVYCLGVALDALTLVGEILTVAVFDTDLFDQIAPGFVDLNDEGSVINTRVPFTEQGVRDTLTRGRLAPVGEAPWVS